MKIPVLSLSLANERMGTQAILKIIGCFEGGRNSPKFKYAQIQVYEEEERKVILLTEDECRIVADQLIKISKLIKKSRKMEVKKKMTALKLITNQATATLINVHDEEVKFVENSAVSVCREGLGIFINATLNNGKVIQIILNDKDAEALCEALAEILQSQETIQ